MQKAAPLLVSLAIIAVLILIAGCVSPGGNETPTATPTSMPTAETTAPTTTTPSQTTIPPTETTMPATTPAATTPTPAQPEQVTVDLVAENIAFDTDTITVPAGAEVTVNFENRDVVQHNFAVYESSDAGTPPVFRGAITGQGKITYTFTAPEEPGTYFFRCDVHPTQMTGDFVVE